MKTPTLIVRLIGYYIMWKALAGTAVQLRATGFNMGEGDISGLLFGLAVLFLGFMMVTNAGKLARRLTADAED